MSKDWMKVEEDKPVNNHVKFMNLFRWFAFILAVIVAVGGLSLVGFDLFISRYDKAKAVIRGEPLPEAPTSKEEVKKEILEEIDLKKIELEIRDQFQDKLESELKKEKDTNLAKLELSMKERLEQDFQKKFQAYKNTKAEAELSTFSTISLWIGRVILVLVLTFTAIIIIVFVINSIANL